jgi:hypothetical protein
LWRSLAVRVASLGEPVRSALALARIRITPVVAPNMRSASMRMMMKVQMPTESGNDAIKDGSLPQIMGSSIEALKAEAAYFTAEDGMRTALIFFEMNDSSDIPPAAELLFMGLGAKITLSPVMNAQEMQSGVAKATEAM